jgi:hypothetical protein
MRRLACASASTTSAATGGSPSHACPCTPSPPPGYASTWTADISGLLGFLRELNRRYNVSLLLVHHMSKRARRDPGQALRGSSDLHAWTDSACYLTRRDDHRLRLTVEHRGAPSPDPLLLRLCGGADGEPLGLRVTDDDGEATPPTPLVEALRTELRRAGRPLSRAALRERLRVNNARLGGALRSLERHGLVVRGPGGWSLPTAESPPATSPSGQIDLLH